MVVFELELGPIFGSQLLMGISYLTLSGGKSPYKNLKVPFQIPDIYFRTHHFLTKPRSK